MAGTGMLTARNRAQVAELVDALASGASGRKVVEVRVFSGHHFPHYIMCEHIDL